MQWQSFDNDDSVAEALAGAVAEQLRSAIRARGQATMALSGGTTPIQFMRKLATQELDWNAVTVTLADERWVPPQDPRSNARLIHENLLHGRAAAAHFIPLYVQAPTPENGLPRVAAHIDALPLPLDVVTLGMGEDGHTASLFPGGDHLAEALAEHGSSRVLPMRAPGADEPRITLTLPLLAGTRALFVQISGETKRQVLIDAMHGADHPVGVVLRAAVPEVQTYWCP